ncbi:MAG: glycosyltransferase family 4 protein [Candidatus Hydrogenedentota bacterium]|nr:MAG: glycosyltransferase family 4 protein [Candidatus Hydrogenedentota bacterium]
MKIAQISPLIESVPPKAYGGTERVVSYLTEELVRLGHEVTLFASADSKTSANLVPCTPIALRFDERNLEPVAIQMAMLEEVFHRAPRFDVLHFHIDYLHLPLAVRQKVPHVATMHGRMDLPYLPIVFGKFPDAPLVSISDDQRRPLPNLNWKATIYHGLPKDLYRFQPNTGKYLAFLGRISPEKRVDRAIGIAKRTGIPLKIAAKVDRKDEQYFKEQIRPLLNDPLVEFVGEIGESEKEDFLGNALGLLFPIDWPEPFGLVMIEAFACGTPVIAYRRGSVPEVMEDGRTGFIVDPPTDDEERGLAEAAAAVRRLESLDRADVRRVFERRFTAERMARNYVALYRSLAERRDEVIDMRRKTA